MEKDINDLKIEMSKLAERIAGEVYGIELDYSVESIKKVEKVLGDLHKQYKKTKADDGYYGIAIEFGAYIVRVVEKNDPTARWERNHPGMGEDSFPLFIGASAVFPVSWCYKRLLDGPGDDVWTKYQLFILKNEKPEPTEGDGFLGKVKDLFKK